MYDKYDSPHGEEPQDYGPFAQEQLGEQATPIIDALKANWKMIAAAIAILLIAYFAYDFFIGSYREVSVQATSTEGASVPVSVKITTESGQPVATISSGQKARLKLGTYMLSAAAQGYKPISSSQLSVTANSTEKLELEADKDITLKGELPQVLITGEKREIDLTLTNNGASQEKVELVAEGDAAKDLKLEYRSPIDVSPGENTIRVNLEVSEKGGSKDGTGRSGSIRVKGLRAGAVVEGEYELIEFDEAKFDVFIGGDKANVNFGTLLPGEHKQRKMTFDNRNSFDIEELVVEKHLASSGFEKEYKIEDWFTFNPKGAIYVKAQDRSKEVQLDLAIPRDVEFPESTEPAKVSGTITLGNTFYSREFTFTFDVKKPEARLDIEMDLNPRIRSKDKVWEPINSTLRVVNKGKVKLTDIRLHVSCNPEGSQWLRLLDSGSNEYRGSISIAELAVAADAKTVAYRTEASPTAKAGETVVCTLKARYDDPNGTAQPVEKIVTIRAE